MLEFWNESIGTFGAQPNDILTRSFKHPFEMIESKKDTIYNQRTQTWPAQKVSLSNSNELNSSL